MGTFEWEGLAGFAVKIALQCYSWRTSQLKKEPCHKAIGGVQVRHSSSRQSCEAGELSTVLAIFSFCFPTPHTYLSQALPLDHVITWPFPHLSTHLWFKYYIMFCHFQGHLPSVKKHLNMSLNFRETERDGFVMEKCKIACFCLALRKGKLWLP